MNKITEQPQGAAPTDGILGNHKELPQRRSIRLKGYDYSQGGLYFITICTQNRLCFFGEIENGEMILNDVGMMIERQWRKLANRFHYIQLHEFVVMPNHFHGIIEINRRGDPCDRPFHRQSGNSGDHKDRPYGTYSDSVGRVIQAFKSITTHEYIGGVNQYGWPPFSGKLWQRNYYEHIIRNEESCYQISEYIQTNPLKWQDDKYHA